jgi:hypothetical protein
MLARCANFLDEFYSMQMSFASESVEKKGRPVESHRSRQFPWTTITSTVSIDAA